MASQSSVLFQVTVGRIRSIVGGGGGGSSISTRREDIYKNGVDHKEEKKNDDGSYKRCELRPGKAL